MFKRPRQWVATVALVAGVLTACSDLPGPTEAIVPSTETSSASLKDAATRDNEFTFVRLAPMSFSQSTKVETRATVGPAGGTITAGDHSLVIPEGAVLGKTEFRVEIMTGDNIRLDLRAKSAETGEEISQFEIPLILRLSYKRLAWGTDVTRLRNVYLIGDSTSNLVALPSKLDEGSRTIMSPIYHFSQYGMAIE